MSSVLSIFPLSLRNSSMSLSVGGPVGSTGAGGGALTLARFAWFCSSLLLSLGPASASSVDLLVFLLLLLLLALWDDVLGSAFFVCKDGMFWSSLFASPSAWPSFSSSSPILLRAFCISFSFLSISSSTSSSPPKPSPPPSKASKSEPPSSSSLLAFFRVGAPLVVCFFLSSSVKSSASTSTRSSSSSNSCSCSQSSSSPVPWLVKKSPSSPPLVPWKDDAARDLPEEALRSRFRASASSTSIEPGPRLFFCLASAPGSEAASFFARLLLDTKSLRSFMSLSTSTLCFSPSPSASPRALSSPRFGLKLYHAWHGTA
mmetsp:Transcript_7763/g.19857  ORF Transcript_7763/g.19857 Transcript_7763/m.19857 type:complete len:316 (-) Transcript_7763:453-1400(-)